jgi:hypothetical protein
MKTYDINFLAGQIFAQRAALLALAKMTCEPEEWKEQALQDIERAKASFLSEPVLEKLLDGIAEVETWLLSATEPT